MAKVDEVLNVDIVNISKRYSMSMGNMAKSTEQAGRTIGNVLGNISASVKKVSAVLRENRKALRMSVEAARNEAASIIFLAQQYDRLAAASKQIKQPALTSTPAAPKDSYMKKIIDGTIVDLGKDHLKNIFKNFNNGFGNAFYGNNVPQTKALTTGNEILFDPLVDAPSSGVQSFGSACGQAAKNGMQKLSSGLTMLKGQFGIAGWQILLIVGLVILAIYAWNNWGNAGKILAIVIAGIIAVMAIWNIVQWALNTSLYACPIIWIIILIVALIAIIVMIVMWVMELWKTNMDFKYGVIAIWNSILGFFDKVPLFFKSVWYGILNGLGMLKVGFLIAIQSLVNEAIDLINPLLKIFNELFGTDYKIEHTTIASDAAAKEAELRAQRATELAADKQAIDDKAAKRNEEMKKNRAADEAKLAAQKKKAAKDKKKNDLKNILTKPIQTGNAKKASKQTTAQKLSLKKARNTGANTGAKTGAVNNAKQSSHKTTVDRVEKPVKVSDDSVKALREVAEMQYVRNFVSLTPTVHVQTGDIKNGDDADSIVRRINKALEEGVNVHAKGVYA